MTERADGPDSLNATIMEGNFRYMNAALVAQIEICRDMKLSKFLDL